MLKFALLIAAAIFLTGCYEESVVERRSYRPRHDVYVSERPYYNDGYYRSRPRGTYYRGGYQHGGYYGGRPSRGRVIVGF